MCQHLECQLKTLSFNSRFKRLQPRVVAFLLYLVFALAGCASSPTTSNSPYNDPDDQRDRRDNAIEELDKATQ